MKVVILITAANKKEAKKIAVCLVQKRLVACVNIVGGIESVFWWEKRIDSNREVLLIAKSKKSLIPKITRRIKSLHSYQVPEVIALPIVAGNKHYISWIDESIR